MLHQAINEKRAIRMGCWASCVAFVAGLCGSTYAAPVADGNARIDLLGPVVFTAPLGDGALFTDTGVRDQLYKYCWYYRTQQDNMNRLFSDLDRPIESVSGNTLTLTYTNAGPSPAGIERFNATFTITLLDGTAPGSVRVSTRLSVTSLASTTRLLTIMHICDLDLSGGEPNWAPDDSAQVTAAGSVRQVESSSSNFAEIVGVGASRTKIDSGFNLRTAINGTRNGLISSPISSVFSGDAAAAFQWNLTIAPGETKVIDSSFAINLPAIAPVCPCSADFDRSGGTPDASDIELFFAAWSDGVPSADVDCSGGTPDATDINTFFQQWLAGGC